jgi:acyl-CoA synthetase (AMP-forming)/AMP-acid ligase II
VNLSLLLDMAADGFGDRIVLGLRDRGTTAERLRQRSFAGSRILRDRAADGLIYLGVNSPLFPASLFAAAQAGVPLIPLNYRLGDEQLRHLIAQHPDALAVADDEHCERLAIAGIQTFSMKTWSDALDGPSEATEAPRDDNCPAVLIYTSGTTSAPKGVVIRHANLLSYVFDTVEFASAGPEDAALISVPPYHIAAVANAVTNLYAGRRSVILEQFSGPQWLVLARRERITNALLVPTMLARVVNTDDEDLRVPTLRTVAYGGAAMPPQVIERALRVWPQVDFVNAYGLTETSSTIAVLGPEDHRAAIASDDDIVRARLHSAGHVVPGVGLQIRDDCGNLLPHGQIGRIWVRGAQISGEYAGIGSTLDSEGYFDTRDTGYLDGDGYLFVVGRADDTIIRGGENVAPAEIEAVLLRHADVADAVVVGIPDDEWGYRIESAVVLHPKATATPPELIAYVRERLRGSKTPERIVVWDELPRNDIGKIVRREAQARLADDRT